MKLFFKSALSICLLVLSLSSSGVSADNNAPPHGAKTKAEAARKAQEQVQGRVLKVEQRGDVFRVKILQASGRVISIEVRRVPNNRS